MFVDLCLNPWKFYLIQRKNFEGILSTYVLTLRVHPSIRVLKVIK